MKLEVQIVNAFIDGEHGGNPAGVVLDADALTREQKLHIAGQVGLSETAFVSASARATYKLEFFTPTRQIAHCGHATVATFSLLRQLGRVGEGQCTKETIDGNRDIFVDGDMAFMEQRAPRYTPVPADSPLGKRALAALGLRPEQLLAGQALQLVNTGNSFLLLPLRDEQSLRELQTDMDAIAAISDELDLIGFYPFSLSTRQAGRHAGARMFAPRYGINEEAGTGMAAGPLACLLHDQLGVKTPAIFIEQGWLMPQPSPSVIHTRLDLVDGRIVRLMAGGTARALSSISVTL